MRIIVKKLISPLSPGGDIAAPMIGSDPAMEKTGVTVSESIEPGIPSVQLESSPTTVELTWVPSKVTFTVLPGRPIPVNVIVS